MSRALAHCLWCGTDLSAPRPGRVPTFCDDGCRSCYHLAFGTHEYAGAVLLEGNACPCHGSVKDTADFPGPVRAPGAYAAAYAELLEAMYGHPVAVAVHPIHVASPVDNVVGGLDTGHSARWEAYA